MIYLNNASSTFPKPKEVCEAVSRSITESGWSNERNTVAKVDYIFQETREIIARMINAEDCNQVIFTSNATEALNLAIKGFLRRGDHVITTSLEHNSVIRPLKHLELDKVIDLSIVQASSEGEVDINEISARIRGNTKLIAATHVSNVLGNILPIENIGQICSKNNIRFLVDTSQGIGIEDVDVKRMNIDMLAFPGHKNLFGPSGTGALYIKKGIDLLPLKHGGTGNISEPVTQPDELPYKYESGTPNTIGISGLNAGLKYIQKVGPETIKDYEGDLTRYMHGKLQQVKGITLHGPSIQKGRTGIISLNVGDKKPMYIAKMLLTKYGILTRPGLHCAPLTHQSIGTFKDGTVRFSLSYFSKKEDIDCAIRAISELSSEE